jgi:hypothetical protein
MLRVSHIQGRQRINRILVNQTASGIATIGFQSPDFQMSNADFPISRIAGLPTCTAARVLNDRSVAAFVPQGQPTLAQHFNAGAAGSGKKVPQGRQIRNFVRDSAEGFTKWRRLFRPFGTRGLWFVHTHP